MKRSTSGLLSILLALCMVLSLLPGTALAAEVASDTCGDNLTWTLTDNGTLTISGTGDMADYSSKTSGRAPWYSRRSSITSVDIKSGVTSIGAYAFDDCSSLTSVSIPDSVNSIGEIAFRSCKALPRVTIPNSVTTIRLGTFSDCSSLTSVSIPESVTSIGDNAFGNCTSLTNLTIPGSVKTIGKDAFSHCKGLTSVIIPDGVTSIGSGAFDFCTALKSVVIPESVTAIGGSIISLEGAFGYCDGLASAGPIGGNYNIQFGWKKSIPDGAFAWCTGLTSVILPDSITSIGESLFLQCTSLSSVTIPDGVTTIGEGAFNGCRALASVNIPDSVTSIGDHAFQSCNVLASVNIPEKVTSIGTSAFYDCSSLTNVTIPEGVTSIADFTFAGCVKMTNVTISRSVTAIGASAFAGCGLTDVYYGGSEDDWDKIDIKKVPGTIDSIVEWENNGNDPLLSATVHPEIITCTVSFDANGGSVDTAGRTVIIGEPYGDLPTPVWAGHKFDGWYTKIEGGTLIISNTTVTETEDHTLYAHWAGPYNLGDETYSFNNFGDSDSPDGHCFGMSMTSAGYYNDFLDISIIGGSADTPLYSFSGTETVKRPICYYQDIQGTFRDRATVAGGSHYLTSVYNIASDWQEVVNYVSNHNYDGTGLLQIGFRKINEGGHAINFLRYENVNGQDRIYAYDNNFPTQETYFYQDSSGRVRQTPRQTFSGAIDCIALRNCETYFNSVGNFDATHVLYMAENAATVQGYTYTYMEVASSDEEYVMYEIPADVDRVIIIPLRDNAEFVYMDTTYSFGEITDETRGELSFASVNDGTVDTDASFQMFECDSPTVTLNKTTLTLTEGESETLTATVTPDDTNSNVTWTSSDPSVATVADGKVTAVKAGTATITVTLEDGGNKSTCTVTVLGGTSITPTAPTTSSSSSYQITVSPTENGTATVTPQSAKYGKKVNITATPDVGYIVGSVTVTDSRGKSVTVTDNGDGTYSFTMPSGKVTVDVTFVPAEDEPTEEPWINPFTDVSESDWFYDDVAYVAENGFMVGVASNRFNPNGTTTRGMLMTILARMDGTDTGGGKPWYQPGMEWAVAKGMSDGTRPEGEITREQFVTMLWRYAGKPAATGDLSAYSDADKIHSWASDAMAWAVENGIIVGYNGGRLEPQGNALRSQAAALLTRFCKKIVN